MDSRFKVVVIGGGVAGCSLTYHLTRFGCAEVALVEADDLTSGSTWHAAGLCTQYHSRFNLMKLLRTSIQLYDEELPADTGAELDYHRCGSLRLARTPERVDEIHARRAMACSLGIPFDVIGPDRVAEVWPLARLDDVVAAAWLPTDGWIDPSRLAQVYVDGARSRGARILRRAPVRALSRTKGVWVVETGAGTVIADVVVNAAGQWAREVGRLAGVELPITPLLHQYLTTVAVPELQGLGHELPVLRDPDGSFYVRQDQDGLLVGPFECRPKSWGLDGIPEGFHGRLLDPDLEQVQGVLGLVGDRIPAFADVGIRTVVNGPDGYTPDGLCLMGPVPEVPNFHVLAGFSIFGIVFSGGAGKYAAEWILEGQPGDSMWDVDVRRFGEYASGVAYTEVRAKETYAREYAIHFPHEELDAGRPLKTDPLYDRLASKGAVFGARFGWERPLFFSSNPTERDEHTFRRAAWHDEVGQECMAVSSGVGVLDQTSFGKYLVSGPGAQGLLDHLCANRLPPSDGRISLTQLCNERGGVECDLTVTRLSEDRFYVVSAAATETHDLAWIADHAPTSGVDIANVSPSVGVLTIAGPRSRALLERVAWGDCSSSGIGFFRAVETHVGSAPVRVMRLSYVGELGYELHHPVEYQRYLYDLLFDAGEDLGLADFGYRALEAMRLEKCYRLWGQDLSSDFTPLESGMERFVQLEGRSFLGRDALAAQAANGVARLLCCLEVDVEDADAHGFEPVLRDGERVGYVTSGGYGHRVRRSLALAYLLAEHSAPGTRLTVEILGSHRPAIVVPQPVYDPANERLRAG
jgi:dimethylglycine dehydrogenase